VFVAVAAQQAASPLPGRALEAEQGGAPKKKKKKPGRAPSCNGCARRESVLASTMRLDTYRHFVRNRPAVGALACLLILAGALLRRYVSRPLMLTLFYALLYFIASPTAILVNKILMKDYGFGYPVLVSSLGQLATSACAALCVHFGGVSTETGRRVPRGSMLLLGGAPALALVLGQSPYLYLTVAFIQMLKAFSPA